MGPGRTGVPASLALPSTWAAQPPLESQAPASSIQSVFLVTVRTDVRSPAVRLQRTFGWENHATVAANSSASAATVPQRLAVFLDSLAVPGTILLLRLPARNPRCSRLAQTVRRVVMPDVRRRRRTPL